LSNAQGAVSQSVTVKRDASAPSINVELPSKKKKNKKNKSPVYTYKRGSYVTANFSCFDNESGLAATSGCIGSTPNGGALDTGTRGSKVFAVTARNAAGISSSVSVTYVVK
jgi:hypothetical protein